MAVTQEITGIQFPLRFGPLGHFDRASGAAKLRGNIHAIILTTVGERIMRPDFGTLALPTVFRNAEQNVATFLASESADAVAKGEPRVRVTAVEGVADRSEGTITVSLGYEELSSGVYDSLSVVLKGFGGV